MPPPAKAAAAFRPPCNWRDTYQRIRAHHQSLPDLGTCHPSPWIRTLTADAELRRFHLLVGVMLTALARQTACAVVMDGLIRDGLTPQSVQAMGEEGMRARLATIHLGQRKARYITQTADILLRDYGGRVPRGYDKVIAFPGVGPKMANLFCLVADGELVGLPVDTHVHRVSQRLRWVPATVKTPEDTRKCLESWLPRECWSSLGFDLVRLGQDSCRPRHPKCEACCVRELCPHGQRFTSK